MQNPKEYCGQRTNGTLLLTITRLPMGHAIGVVPLQTHCSMSVIANDGVLTKPLIIKKILNGREVILENFPAIKRQVLSQETAVRMQKVMHNPENGKLPCGVSFRGKINWPKNYKWEIFS